MICITHTAPTCASAWVGAAETLINEGDRAYNLVVDIENPIVHRKCDKRAILTVDQFLRTGGVNPIATVANTIFPQDQYRRFGPEKFTQAYLDAYDAIRDKGWGRYFERMIRWPNNGGGALDQLHTLIERLKKNQKSKQSYRSVYEMTLFDPLRDANLYRGRQCLSFLSFKLDPERGLILTAMYRNHYYITRALGNFIGLGNLMSYIASSAGIRVGPLTCISTRAKLDTVQRRNGDDDNGDACFGWTIRQARTLVSDASKILGRT